MLCVMSCGHLFLVCANLYINVNCVTPFGVAITGKPALIIDCISHPAVEEPIKYDMTLDLASGFLQK